MPLIKRQRKPDPLPAFLAVEGNHVSMWLQYKWGEIYVRKSIRYIRNQRMPVIDVANITVRAKHQKRGQFTNWLRELQTKCDRTIYIEHIHELWFANWFERQGFEHVDKSAYPWCMIKRSINREE